MPLFRIERRTALFLALVALVGALSLGVPGLLPVLTDLAAAHPVLGALAFIGAMFVATVAAPIAVLPTVPLVALILGPFATAVYSVIGWSLGAIAAFLIARHIARPVLERYVPLESIARYERYIPEDAKFWWVVLLRLVIPVDVLSYAIGIVSKMPLGQYAAATVIGVTPFSFAFAYVGVAFLSQSFVLFASFVVLLAITASAWYYIVHVRR